MLYLGICKVTFQTDGIPMHRIAVRIQRAGYFGDLLKNQKWLSGSRSAVAILGWSAVRGRPFGPWARSAVVKLGHGRGPRSSMWAWGAVRGRGYGPKARSRGRAVKHNPCRP